MALVVDYSMWDSLGSAGLSAEGAQSKRPDAYGPAPVQQPMQANIKPAQRKKPTGDQKKHRRQMRRSAAGFEIIDGRTLTPSDADEYWRGYFDGEDNADQPAAWIATQSEAYQQGRADGAVGATPKYATKSSTTTSKESTAMTAQPTEADLLTALAAATTLAEQTAISAQIEDLRTARRETVAQRDSFHWDGLGALPPTHMQASASAVLGGTSLPPATASMRLGHSEATDWLDDLTPTETGDAVLSAQARSQATLWFESLWDAVKQTPEEFSVQAHNAATRTATAFGLQSTAARSVFLDQVKHLASREGLRLTAFEETVDTYVSDGKTTQPVGVDPDDVESMDEWGISSDANQSGDPKSTTDRGDAPSLSEGDSPETGSQESLDNPNFAKGDDSSSWDKGWTDRMNTQSAAAPKGTCSVCGEPMEQEGDGSWSHMPGHPDDHEAKSGKSSARKTSVFLKNVGVDKDSGNGVGTDPNGNRVQFRLTEKERADLKSVLLSDLAINFSGVTVEESDIIKDASRRTANEYKGGSPKAGDKATCHADGKPIEFFDGQWMHYANGPSHNDVHPATPKEQADKAKESSLDAMFAAFASDTRSIQTIAEGDSTSADGLSSADAPEEAPSLQYGDTPETGHQEPYTQNPGEGASDSSSATESDRPGGGVNWGTTSALMARMASHPQFSENTRTFAASLARMRGLEDQIGGVSARQVLSLLLSAPDVPAPVKQALRVVAEGQTCSVCGDKIAQDPNGENPSTWHHDNGEKHDHEAKPGGGDSKESSRRTAAEWSDANPGKSRCQKTEQTKAGRPDDQRYVRCTKEQGHDGEHDFSGSKSVPAPTASRRTAARECQWTRVSEPGEDDGLTWWECSTHGKTEMGGETEEPSFPCEGWLDENDADRGPYTGSRKVAVGRPLYEIAADIRRNWPNPYFGAVPYLDALGQLSSMDDKFYEDDAATIVHYLLSNMGSKFKGPEAARLKAELKALVGRTSSKEAGRDPFSREAITRTPPGPGWDALKPGDKIRIGFEEYATNGTFVRLEPQSNPDFYGDAPVVIYTDESGRERTYLPTGNESPRPAREASRRTAGFNVERNTGKGGWKVVYRNVSSKEEAEAKMREKERQTGYDGYLYKYRVVENTESKESARRTAGRYEVKKFQGGPGNMWGIWDSQEDTWHDGDHSDAQYAAGIPFWRDEAKAKAAAESLGGTTATLNPAFARRVQAGIKRIAAPRGNDFSISDAKNEDGEWVMSPEQIRAEMNYDPSEDYDPYEDDFHEGSRRQAAEHPGGAWKAQVAGNGEMVWSQNDLRFDTPEEAKAYIGDLSMRWFGFDLGRVVPADTPNREPVDLSDPQITHNFR